MIISQLLEEIGLDTPHSKPEEQQVNLYSVEQNNIDNFSLAIDLGDENDYQIDINPFTNPEEQAILFCSKYGLDQQAIPVLRDYIQRNMNIIFEQENKLGGQHKPRRSAGGIKNVSWSKNELRNDELENQNEIQYVGVQYFDENDSYSKHSKNVFDKLFYDAIRRQQITQSDEIFKQLDRLSSNRHRLSDQLNLGSFLYYKGIQQKQEAQKNLEILKEQKTFLEEKQLTFTPVINKQSQQIAVKQKQKLITNLIIFEFPIKKENSRQKNEPQRTKTPPPASSQIEEKCTFQPKIDRMQQKFFNQQHGNNYIFYRSDKIIEEKLKIEGVNPKDRKRYQELYEQGRDKIIEVSYIEHIEQDLKNQFNQRDPLLMQNDKILQSQPVQVQNQYLEINQQRNDENCTFRPDLKQTQTFNQNVSRIPFLDRVNRSCLQKKSKMEYYNQQ